MSALATPPSPRLRAVSAGSAPRAAASLVRDGSAAVVKGRRAHLRLVTEDFEVARGTGDGGGAQREGLPLEVTRRPSAVGRPARRSAEELAPSHPAVRAARARRERAASHGEAPHAVAPSPVALRRLLVMAAAVLAVVLIVAGGIVASAFVPAPERTTVATVQPGQSIWDLAAATGSSDVAETAAQIVELNNLTSSTVQAGQTLIVPAG